MSATTLQHHKKSNPETDHGHSNLEYSIVFVVSFLFWLSILGFTGTLSSGFHFTDDHEIIRLNDEIQQDGNIFKTITRWIRLDLQQRVRTFYYIHRILETSVFQTNFLAWSIYNLFLAALTSTLLYTFGRLIQFSIPEASIFALFILLGEQSCIWWRLGPAETIGMVSFSLSLVLHGLAASRQNKNLWIESFAFIASILAAASKESFILMIPPVALLRILITDKSMQIGWKRALRENGIAVLMLGILFFAAILLVLKIGTENIGYAGIEGFTLTSFLKTISAITRVNHAGKYIIILSIITILLPSSNKVNLLENMKCLLNRYSLEVVFSLSVILLQAFLYTKSGIYGRYLVPAMLGCAFFLSFLIQSIRQRTKFSYQAQVFTLLFLAYMAFNALRYSVIPEASNFTVEGHKTKDLIARVVNETDRENKIIVIADPAFQYESAFSLIQYLSKLGSRPNLQVETVESIRDYDPFSARLRSQFPGLLKEYPVHENSSTIPDASCLVIFPDLERLVASTANLSIYSRWDYGLADVYCKRVKK